MNTIHTSTKSFADLLVLVLYNFKQLLYIEKHFIKQTRNLLNMH